MHERSRIVSTCFVVLVAGSCARSRAPVAEDGTPEPPSEPPSSPADTREPPAEDAPRASDDAAEPSAEADAHAAHAAALLGAWDKVADAPWRAQAKALASDDPRHALCMSLMYEPELCEADACRCWVAPLSLARGARPLVGAALVGVSHRPAGSAEPTLEEWALVLDTGERWVAGASAMSYHEDKIGFYHRSRLTLGRSEAARPLVRLDLVEAVDDFGPGDSEIVREVAWSILCGVSEAEPLCVNVDRGVREGAELGALAARWRRELKLEADGRVTLGALDAPGEVLGTPIPAGTYTLEALAALSLGEPAEDKPVSP